jgi:hypothetical protein
MAEPLPLLLIPGLNCSARLYAEQTPRWGDSGPSRSPIARATRAWMRLWRASSPTRRNRSGHAAPESTEARVSAPKVSCGSTGPALRDPTSKLRPCQVEHMPQDPKPIHSSPRAGSPDYAPRSEGTPAVKLSRNRTAIDHHGALWREIAEGMAFLSLPIAIFTTAGVGVVA